MMNLFLKLSKGIGHKFCQLMKSSPMKIVFYNLTSARRQTDKFVCLLNVRDKWYQSTNVNKAKSNN